MTIYKCGKKNSTNRKILRKIVFSKGFFFLISHHFATIYVFFLLAFFLLCCDLLASRADCVGHCHFTSSRHHVLCIPFRHGRFLQIRFYFVQQSQLWPTSWSGTLNYQFQCLTRYVAFVTSHEAQKLI